MRLKVSVIITVCNRYDFLQEAIVSALGQQLAPLEVLVVDDGSEAKHHQKILEIANSHERVELIRLEQNAGVSHARNYGAKCASGDYVLFLDDDDVLAQGYLSDVETWMEAQPDTDVLISRTQLFCSDPNGEHFQKVNAFHRWLSERYHFSPVSSPYYFLVYCPAIHAMLFKKELFRQFQFDDGLQYGEDRFLLLSMKRQGVRFQISDRIGAYYRIHGQSSVLNHQLRWIKKMQKSEWVKNHFERAYLHLLVGYFFWKGGCHLKALLRLVKSLQSVDVIRFLWGVLLMRVSTKLYRKGT